MRLVPRLIHQSRPDIALQFKDLDGAQRRSIFEEFLTQLNNKSLVKDWDDVMDWVKEVCDDPSRDEMLNGRQIRNIVSTAVAIAQADGRKLERRYLKDVWKHTTAFMSALQEQNMLYRNKQIQRGGGYHD